VTTQQGSTAEPWRVRLRRARWWWIAAAAALIVVAAAAVVVIVEHNAWARTVATYEAHVARLTDEAATSRASAETAYEAALDALDQAIEDGRAAHTASKGQVADPAVREPLARAVDDAVRLRDTDVTYPVASRTVEEVTRPNPIWPGSRPEVEVEVVEGSQPAPADLDAAASGGAPPPGGSGVAAATAVVVDARRKWALTALESVMTESRDARADLRDQIGAGALKPLGTALDDAEAMLEAGAGRLDPDDAVALRDTLLRTTRSLWTDRLEQIYAERRAAARADGVDCRTARCVALTFDDGPVPDTRRLLRILERKNAPATFFMVGENVAQHPEIARAVARGGHLVANHSWDHPQLTTLDDAGVRDQLRRTQDAIKKATGDTSFLLRPPYGAVDDRVRALATRTGLDVVLWSLDTEDWRTRDAAEIRRRVHALAAPGSNVLLHDIHSSSVDAVPGIIDDLRKQGYVLVTADLLAK
jgi:peptidoglycan/xylan/chitin deacetylase (PgdA/CDA1 family)